MEQIPQNIDASEAGAMSLQHGYAILRDLIDVTLTAHILEYYGTYGLRCLKAVAASE